MSSKRVLIYGGRGALGSVCVDYFKAQSWWTCCVDLVANEAADSNVVVHQSDSLVDQTAQVTKDVGSILGTNKLDAILCVAGGWAGGNAAQADFAKNCDLMWKQSCWSSVISAQLGANHLNEGGLLQMTGAQAALNATPGMIGYGMAKAAVHQLVRCLATSEGGLPANSTAIAILPVTLDTPMNRKWMPKADHSTWTSMDYVAKILHDWCEERNRPKSGSLVQLITKGGETSLVIE